MLQSRAALAEVALHRWRGAMRRRPGARVVWFAVLFTLWAVGYFYVGHSDSTRRARELTTALDRGIPFVGWTVWIYLAGLPMTLAPVFVLRSQRHFRRTAWAYAGVIVASLACFFAFPVTSAALRADVNAFGLDPLTWWAVRTLLAIDPPYNLFPSLHVSLCALAALSMAEAAPRSRVSWYGALALVAMSVCTTKQHVALDVLGGLALALASRDIVARLNGRPATAWRMQLRRRAASSTFVVGVFTMFCIFYVRAA